MNIHNKDIYPHHNTDKIHAMLALHGFTFKKPSQLSDAFRLGYIASKTNLSDEGLIDLPNHGADKFSLLLFFICLFYVDLKDSIERL